MDNDDLLLSENDENPDDYYGEKQICPYCGQPLIGKDLYGAICCMNCGYGIGDAYLPRDGGSLSKYEIAQIWLSSGKDPDYTFGYTGEELEDALNSGSCDDETL